MSGPARVVGFRSLVAVLALCPCQTLQSQRVQTSPPSAPSYQQSTAPPATGLILGQVLDAGSGKPVPGAVVSLSVSSAAALAQAQAAVGLIALPDADFLSSAGPNVPTRIIADAQGRFVFRNLAKGRYAFSATAPGYLLSAYGQKRPGGPTLSLELEEGEKLHDVTFRMWKSATLAGTVVDEAGEPVIAVTVRTFRRTIAGGKRRWGPGPSAQTDDRGIYRIANLTPGDYTVAVISTQSTMPAAIVDAYREAVLAGGGATTQILRDLQASGSPSPSLTGFRVGDYVIQQSGRGLPPPPPTADAKVLAYQTVFYPSAASAAQLTVITLASGEQRSGIDLHLRLVPTFRVSGIVGGTDGPAANIGVHLLPASVDEFASESGLDAATTATDANGAFTFLGVPAGSYALKVLKSPRPVFTTSSEPMVLMGSPAGGVMFGTSLSGGAAAPPPPLPMDPTLWATLPVAVAETDVSGVVVSLRTGLRVTGRVEFQGTKDRPTPEQVQRMSVTLTPLDARPATIVAPGRVSADGQFSTIGFPPGNYLVGATAAGTEWTFKAAMQDGRNVSDEPLEIGGSDVGGIVLLFTDRPTELSGIVRSAQGQGDADADVIVFPANHQLWKQHGINPRRGRSVRTTKTGAYTIQGLPPGDYFLVAISSDSSGDWQDPKFLEAAARLATRVTIAEGEKKQQELKTARPKT